MIGLSCIRHLATSVKSISWERESSTAFAPELLLQFEVQPSSESRETEEIQDLQFLSVCVSHLSRGIGIGLEGRDKRYIVDLIVLLLQVNLSLYTLCTKSKKYIEH